MNETNLPGKTGRETHQYLLDRGHRIAAAQAYRYLGRLIEASDAFPLPDGAEAVIALAAAAAAMHDVTAAWQASAEAYAHERAAAIHKAVAEMHTGSTA